jgi:hypothetical protein
LVVTLVLALSAWPLAAAPLTITGPSIELPTGADGLAGGILETLVAGSLVAFGAIRMRDIGSLSKKFVTRAGQASGDYAEGVKGSGGDWEQKTRGAAGTWKQAVTEAAGTDRFERGVSEAGAQKYQSRASTLGAQRYAPGIQASEGEWARGFAPYHQALQGMELGPRGPRGSPANYQISNAVAARLAAIRTGKA